MTEPERNERLAWIHRHQIEDEDYLLEDDKDYDDVSEEAVWEKGFEEEIMKANSGVIPGASRG